MGFYLNKILFRKYIALPLNNHKMIKYIALAILLVFVASTEGDELSRNEFREQWFSIKGNKERALLQQWGLERGQLYRIIELLGNLSKYLRHCTNGEQRPARVDCDAAMQAVRSLNEVMKY